MICDELIGENLHLCVFQLLPKGRHSFRDLVDVLLDLVHPCLELLLLVFGVLCASDELVSREANRDGVEHDLIEE